MAATGTLGQIEEYDSTSDWDQYVERLENFVASADKQRAVFLSVIGPSTYKMLRNLITPAKPADKMLAD